MPYSPLACNDLRPNPQGGANNMASGTGTSSGGPNTTIIVVVALLLVAGIAIWATTSNRVEKRDSTAISGSTTAGDKDSDVDLKVDMPDSVTIDAH